MEGINIYKTEKYSLKYIFISSFIASIFISLIFSSMFYLYDEKLVFNSFRIWILIIVFTLFFVLFITVSLITSKEYIYYCRDGKLYFILENKNSFEFNLKSIDKIYSSKSLYYKGIKIVQIKPVKLKFSFFVKKNSNFNDWLKNEINKVNSENVEIPTRFISYDKLFKLNLGTTFFITLNIINMIYLKMNKDVWINIIISLTCTFGLIVILVKMLKVITKENKKIR